MATPQARERIKHEALQCLPAGLPWRGFHIELLLDDMARIGTRFSALQSNLVADWKELPQVSYEVLLDMQKTKLFKRLNDSWAVVEDAKD